MKIIVISDTHGRSDRVQRVLSLHKEYDAVLFSGDGLCDVQDIAGCVAVRGNCDLSFAFLDTQGEQLLTFDGVRIFMTHGHDYSVKSGTDRLLCHASALGADLVIFGHTHVPCERYIPSGTPVADIKTAKPMHLFNAGSLGGRSASFGVIQIKNGQILMSHGNLN